MSDAEQPDQTLNLDELRSRGLRIFGSASIASAIDRRKAIVFVGRAVDAASEQGFDSATTALAQEALDILKAAVIGQRPSDEQLAALVRCIRFMRPALLVQMDRIIIPSHDRPRVQLSAEQLSLVEQLLPGVAAIGRAGERLGLGTGFLVGPRMLLTNRHVVQALTRSREPAPLLSDGAAVARFGLEFQGDMRKPTVAIRGVAAYPTASELDLALLELAEDGPLPGGLPLGRHASPALGQAVVVLGYPGDDPNAPRWSKLMFDGSFGVKRASPGELVKVEERSCYHDCSTLAGNSGSPVVDPMSGCVIAVHRAGEFAYQNECIQTSWLSQDAALSSRVQNWRDQQ